MNRHHKVNQRNKNTRNRIIAGLLALLLIAAVGLGDVSTVGRTVVYASENTGVENAPGETIVNEFTAGESGVADTGDSAGETSDAEDHKAEEAENTAGDDSSISGGETANTGDAAGDGPAAEVSNADGSENIPSENIVDGNTAGENKTGNNAIGENTAENNAVGENVTGDNTVVDQTAEGNAIDNEITLASEEIQNPDNNSNEKETEKESEQETESDIIQSPISSCEVTYVTEVVNESLPEQNGTSKVMRAPSNDGLPGKDLGSMITGATFEKQKDGLWVTVKDGVFTDGDAIRVTIKYSVPANTINGVNNSIEYQLPAGIKIAKEEQGYVTRTEGDNKINVGTYTIGTDGLITITFYPEFADGKEFNGTIRFEAKLDKSQTGDDGTIEIGGSGGTIKIIDQPEEYDIKTEKDCDYDQDKNQLSYTITTSSTKGTAGPVQITDAFKEGVNGANYDADSFVITYIDKDNISHDITSEWKNSLVIDNAARQFSLDGLPQLQAGERYVIRYTATPDDNGMDEDGYQKVGNWAYSKSGSNGNGDGTETVIHEAMLNKEGHYDPNTGLITWTIVVNKGYENLKNYTITDPIKQGMKIQGDVKVVEKTKEGKETTTYITPTEHGDVRPTQLKMTLSGNSKYTITFQTTAPEVGETGKVIASNTVEDDDGRKSKGETEVKNQDNQIEKECGNEGYDNQTGTVYRTWNVDLTVPSGKNQTIVYRDEIKPAVFRNGTQIDSYENTHYTTWTELSKILQPGAITITRRSGYDTTQPLGIAIRAWTDADKKVEVLSSDTTTPILYWELTITPAESNQDQIAGVNFAYRTVTDFSRMPSDTEWRFENWGWYGKKYDSAAFDRIQKKAIEKQAASVWKGHRNANVSREGFRGGEVSWELNEDGTWWYRLVVRTSYETKGMITITDDLPEGVTIAGLNEFCNEADQDGFATIRTDWNYNYEDDCPVLILMGNEQQQSSAHYRVERVATVSYNEQTRHLEIRIPYEDPTDGEGYDYQHWNGNDGTDHQTLSLPFFEIAYKVTLTDTDTTTDKWQDTEDGNLVARKFVNQAAWGTHEDSVTTEITKPKKRIAKTVSQLMEGENPTSVIEYTIVINAGAEDLDPTSNVLRLIDKMTTADGVTARLLIDSIKLYAYDSSLAEIGYHGDTPLSGDLFQVTDIATEGNQHTFKITLPDQLACVLVYRYDIDLSRTTSEDQRAISNSASLNGKWSEEITKPFKVQASSAEVSYDTLYVYKVDEQDRKITLPGVQFSLQRWAMDTETGVYTWQDVPGGHGDNGWFRTDADGRITLRTADDPQNARIYNNCLYRLQEQDLGENTAYRLTSVPMYFMLHEVGSEPSAAESFLALGNVTDTVNDTVITVAYTDVKVCEITTGGIGVIYFTNSRSMSLPETGGTGTLTMEVVGTGLVILAMVLVVIVYRRRKK